MSRLLVLHGFGQNADMVRQAALPLLSQTDIEFVYVTSPYLASKKQELRNRRLWWNVSRATAFTTKRYDLLEGSKAYVKDVWKQYGPFQDILGFSQGAVLTTTLLAAQAVDSNLLPGLTHAIIISGITPTDESVTKQAESSSFLTNQKVATCSVAGSNDFQVPLNLSYDQYSRHFKQKGLFYRHTGEHGIPKSADLAKKIRLFISS
jgi:predicted esterase